METLQLLQQDKKAMGTRTLNWADVRDNTIWYIESKKAAHRFDGQGSFDHLQRTKTTNSYGTHHITLRRAGIRFGSHISEITLSQFLLY
jgi:hypothetical protein